MITTESWDKVEGIEDVINSFSLNDLDDHIGWAIESNGSNLKTKGTLTKVFELARDIATATGWAQLSSVNIDVGLIPKICASSTSTNLDLEIPVTSNILGLMPQYIGYRPVDEEEEDEEFDTSGAILIVSHVTLPLGYGTDTPYRLPHNVIRTDWPKIETCDLSTREAQVIYALICGPDQVIPGIASISPRANFNDTITFINPCISSIPIAGIHQSTTLFGTTVDIASNVYQLIKDDLCDREMDLDETDITPYCLTFNQTRKLLLP